MIDLTTEPALRPPKAAKLIPALAQRQAHTPGNRRPLDAGRRPSQGRLSAETGGRPPSIGLGDDAQRNPEVHRRADGRPHRPAVVAPRPHVGHPQPGCLRAGRELDKIGI